MNSYVAKAAQVQSYTGFDGVDGLLVVHAACYPYDGTRRPWRLDHHRLDATADGAVLRDGEEGDLLIKPEEFEQIILLELSTPTGPYGVNRRGRPWALEGDFAFKRSSVSAGNIAGTISFLAVAKVGTKFRWDDGRQVFDGEVLPDRSVRMTERAPEGIATL